MRNSLEQKNRRCTNSPEVRKSFQKKKSKGTVKKDNRKEKMKSKLSLLAALSGYLSFNEGFNCSFQRFTLLSYFIDLTVPEFYSFVFASSLPHDVFLPNIWSPIKHVQRTRFFLAIYCITNTSTSLMYCETFCEHRNRSQVRKKWHFVSFLFLSRFFTSLWLLKFPKYATGYIHRQWSRKWSRRNFLSW